MPMINVFMAIIPLLLLSAAFVPVTIIQASLPVAAEAGDPAPAEPPRELSVFIRLSAYVVEAEGLGLRLIPRAPGAAREAARAELAAALAEAVAALPGSREIRIVAEPRARYDEIVDVMDLARAAGLSEVGLAEAAVEGP
jgi:biopolymer transport protein ExbD